MDPNNDDRRQTIDNEPAAPKTGRSERETEEALAEKKAKDLLEEFERKRAYSGLPALLDATEATFADAAGLPRSDQDLFGLLLPATRQAFDATGLVFGANRDLPGLLGLPGASEVHDLHVWAMGTSQIALTAHVVLRDAGADTGSVLHEAEYELREHFKIHHVTLQLESPAHARLCALRAGEGCS